MHQLGIFPREICFKPTCIERWKSISCRVNFDLGNLVLNWETRSSEDPTKTFLIRWPSGSLFRNYAIDSVVYKCLITFSHFVFVCFSNNPINSNNLRITLLFNNNNNIIIIIIIIIFILFYFFPPSVVKIPRVKTKLKRVLELTFGNCLGKESTTKGNRIENLDKYR